jgi:hypothetical protein
MNMGMPFASFFVLVNSKEYTAPLLIAELDKTSPFKPVTTVNQTVNDFLRWSAFFKIRNRFYCESDQNFILGRFMRSI